ncbi:MAG: FtsX-like permease family protein [Candidatus Hodarchaeota archaeon]
MSMLLRKVRRDLGQRKLRTTLTVLGLAIAVIGITGVAIINASVIESAERAYGITLSSDIRILIRETEWNDSLMTGIEGLEDYEPAYRSFTTTLLKYKPYNVVLWGINITRVSKFHSLYGLILDSGSLPDTLKNELLIDASAAHAFNLGIGDNFTIPISSGSSSQVNKISFKISGLARAVRDPGYTFSSSINVWMSLSKIQALLNKPNYTNNLFFKVTEYSDPDDVSTNIMNVLDEHGIFIERVYVYENEEDIRFSILNLMNVLLSITMIIGLLVGGILTTSTIQMAIANEKKDISLMKINGATKRHIFFIYLIESTILGLIGSIIGTILSILFANFLLTSLADPYGLSTLVLVVPAIPLIIGFMIPVVTSIIFALPVIIGTLRISPMEVFQSQVSSKKKVKTIFPYLVLLNFSLSNLSRKKVRFTLISIMLIVAVGSVVGFRAVGDSAVSTVINLLDSMPGDVHITTSTPENETLMTDFLTEFFNENYPTQIDSWTSYWWFSGINMYPTINAEPQRMQLLGIHPDSSLWEAYTKTGSWLSANSSESQVVLTTLYVTRNPQYNLSIGSKVLLGTPLYNESFTITGYIDDINNQGLMLYTSISTLNRFLRAKNLIDSVIIELNDPLLENEVVDALNSNEFVSAKAWNVVGVTFWKEMNIKQIDFLTLFFDLMGIFALLICIIGGINAFSMSVLEREQEIGILKLIGASPKWITLSILSEAFIVGILAGFFGIIMGRFIIAKLLLDIVGKTLVPIPLYFTLDHIILALSTSLLTIVVAAIHPSYRASKTSVISALRYE